LVTEPPAGSTYTISITYSDIPTELTASGQAVSNFLGDRPVKVQVWRDAKSRRILVDHANGVKSEGFLFDSGFVIRSTANSDKTFVSVGGKGRDASLDFFTKDFQGTQWLDMKFYTGIQQADGQPIYTFHQPAGSPPVIDTSDEGLPPNYTQLDYMELTAQLRAADKSPIVVTLGPATYSFSPVQPWSGTITLPENFKTSAENFTQELSIIEALRKKNQNRSEP
jgi:hypothetical protein